MNKADLIFSIDNIVEVKGHRNLEVNGSFQTDSRSVSSGDVFIALNGETHRGFKFSSDVIQNGCEIIITECLASERDDLEKLAVLNPQVTWIIVNNSLIYFQQIAKKWLQEWKRLDPTRFLVGITGSNGKTTTKEILAQLFETIYPGRILATQGNLNNQYGVPMTLLRLNESHQVAIVEIGTNSPGEIQTLSEIIEPEAGIITNIGPAHLEYLKDLEGVYNEKVGLYKIYSRNPSKRIFVADGDDKYLSRLKSLSDVETYSKASVECTDDGDYIIEDDGSTTLFLETGPIFFKNADIVSEHDRKNLIACVYLLCHLMPEKCKKISQAASVLKLPSMNRGGWSDRGSTRIYLDAYNANPGSMQAALKDFFSQLASQLKSGGEDRIWIILGDMNELGEGAKTFHEQVGQELTRWAESIDGIVECFFVGRYCDAYSQGFVGRSHAYSTVEALRSDLLSKNSPGNCQFAFLKASRSLQLESLLDIFD